MTGEGTFRVAAKDDVLRTRSGRLRGDDRHQRRRPRRHHGDLVGAGAGRGDPAHPAVPRRPDRGVAGGRPCGSTSPRVCHVWTVDPDQAGRTDLVGRVRRGLRPGPGRGHPGGRRRPGDGLGRHRGRRHRHPAGRRRRQRPRAHPDPGDPDATPIAGADPGRHPQGGRVPDDRPREVPDSRSQRPRPDRGEHRAADRPRRADLLVRLVGHHHHRRQGARARGVPRRDERRRRRLGRRPPGPGPDRARRPRSAVACPGRRSPAARSSTRRSSLDWRAPESNGSPIDFYEVQDRFGRTTRCRSASCTITGLENGTTYNFRVRAHNAVGFSGVERAVPRRHARRPHRPGRQDQAAQRPATATCTSPGSPWRPRAAQEITYFVKWQGGQALGVHVRAGGLRPRQPQALHVHDPAPQRLHPGRQPDRRRRSSPSARPASRARRRSPTRRPPVRRAR